MKKYGKVFSAGAFAILVAAVAWLGAARVWAQDGDLDLVRAEYGTRTRHVDVTDVVRRLLWEGRDSGRAPVTNQSMGGDPGPGAEKSLHIWARNWRQEEREFDVREGGWIDVRVFHVQEVRDRDRDRDRDYHGDRDRLDDDCWCREGRGAEDRWREERGLRILKAYYGVAGRTWNVTEIVRGLVKNGELRVHVENNAFGGDPAPGAEQRVLIVIFRHDGKESAISTKEGNTMKFP